MPESDTRPSAQAAHDAATREAVGDKPLRNPDGSLMETGHGSAFANQSPAAKAHFHVTAVAAAVEGVLGLAKQLTDALGKIAPLHDAAVKATADAKAAERTAAIAAAQAGEPQPVEPLPPPPPPRMFESPPAPKPAA